MSRQTSSGRDRPSVGAIVSFLVAGGSCSGARTNRTAGYCPPVLYDHDLLPLGHPNWYNRRFAAWYQWLLPRLARKIQHIIAISHFTKQRIVERLGVRPDRVTVIPNGVDERFAPQTPEQTKAVRRSLGINAPAYVLCVGSLEPRKEPSPAAAGLGRITAVVRNGCGSGCRWGKRKLTGIRSVRFDPLPPQVHFTGYVSDEQLPVLYSGALALVYPSLYEGFGLPPLEAMACGTPVVTSNGTSLPEIAGDAAVLVDPEDVDSIAEGILRVVSSSALRDNLRRLGLDRASRATWESTAQQTLQLLLDQAKS